jgi:3D (Asp-Asp-Asp) domain-containing protein
MILPKRNLHVKRVNRTIENNSTGRLLDALRSQDKWLDLFIVGIILLLIGLVFAFIMTTEKFIPVYNQIRTEQSDMNARIDALEKDVTRVSEAVESWPGVTETVIETEAVKAAATETTEAAMRSLGQFTVVAYYKGGNGLLTATGVQCQEGVTVAVDPKVIPYGTRIYIEGIGERIAQDCGGFRGNVVDVYFPDRKTCVDFGKQKLEVWIIE